MLELIPLDLITAYIPSVSLMMLRMCCTHFHQSIPASKTRLLEHLVECEQLELVKMCAQEWTSSTYQHLGHSGNIDIIQHIHHINIPWPMCTDLRYRLYDVVLTCAARNNQVGIIKWILDHQPLRLKNKNIPISAIDFAFRYYSPDILLLFREVVGDDVLWDRGMRCNQIRVWEWMLSINICKPLPITQIGWTSRCLPLIRWIVHNKLMIVTTLLDSPENVKRISEINDVDVMLFVLTIPTLCKIYDGSNNPIVNTHHTNTMDWNNMYHRGYMKKYIYTVFDNPHSTWSRVVKLRRFLDDEILLSSTLGNVRYHKYIQRYLLMEADM